MLFGVPACCIDRVHQLYEEYGIDEFICLLQPGRANEACNGTAIDRPHCHGSHAAFPLTFAGPRASLDGVSGNWLTDGGISRLIVGNSLIVKKEPGVPKRFGRRGTLIQPSRP